MPVDYRMLDTRLPERLGSLASGIRQQIIASGGMRMPTGNNLASLAQPQQQANIKQRGWDENGNPVDDGSGWIGNAYSSSRANEYEQMRADAAKSQNALAALEMQAKIAKLGRDIQGDTSRMESQRGQIVFDKQGRAFNINPYTNEVRPVAIDGQQIQGAQYSPDLQGSIAAAKSGGQETGKATGEAAAKLQDMESMMPRLDVVTKELSELGKKATYTMAGQGVNELRRQLGLGVGEGAIARKAYISKVDNEILPLLRQTFGAQFTQKEGESLKATLGDPNATPEEKDAVLNSFIETKYGQIAGMKRRLGQDVPAPQGGGTGIAAPPQGAVRRVR